MIREAGGIFDAGAGGTRKPSTGGVGYSAALEPSMTLLRRGPGGPSDLNGPDVHAFEGGTFW
jgi:hypothetical protein